MYIICFLTLRPSREFLCFCEQLVDKNYQVYVCIDDNNFEPETNLPIIQIDNSECEEQGYKNSVLWFQNKACARDKALYYFNRINLEYKYIWFIEEDVFIPTITTIKKLDTKYGPADLLTSGHNINLSYSRKWHWPRIYRESKLNFPFAGSMICAIRVSKLLMEYIDDYVIKNNKLFLDEALFNTIAEQNLLYILTPIELSTIVYKKKWNLTDININNLYHPIKDINLQYTYRNKL